MQHTETMKQSQEALADLVEINNDRIEGYEKASKHLREDDDDLRSLFADMQSQSEQFVHELQQQLVQTGEEPEKGTTARGKLYRVWMDVKATFSSDDRKAALESCEFGEDAALRAYSEALSENELSMEVRLLLQRQMEVIQLAHDKIKVLRDSE